MSTSLRRFFSLLLVALTAYMIVSLLKAWRTSGSLSPWSKTSATFQPESYTMSDRAPLEMSDVELLSRLNNEYAKLTQAVVPSVVSIDTAGVREQLLRDPWGRPHMQRQMTQGQGSGVIVTQEGHVVTNQHVIAGQTQIQVKLHNGESYAAILIGEDRLLDIAVLKIQAKGPFVPLKMGDSSQVKVGQIVFAVGNPFGLGETVTQGIISAKERAISDQQGDLFQTDAAINPGNSGGPLVNLQGEIVGINVAIYSPDKSNPGFQGVGFSIPSNDVNQSLKQILEKGRPVHGYLGVRLHPIDDHVQQAVGYDGQDGAFVIDVIENSPAAAAGLKRGDVIVEFNGKVVLSPIQVIQALQRTELGQEVVLKTWRNGEILLLRTKVADNVASLTEQTSRAQLTESALRRLGLLVRSLSSAESASGLSGVAVTRVDPEGAAAALAVNDLIIAVNEDKIIDAPDFYQQCIASLLRQDTKITLIRDRRVTIVTLPAFSSSTGK
ncbi:MAG: hypothetical protein RL117_596 [Verrucomicrobiota bacterium]|jgi:S1-C subfamily serine protease